MALVSVNVGEPREVTYRGRDITTGIFKTPVEGRVRLRRLNLDGDRQADLSVHGGESKAVYCYPIEHYAWWAGELGRTDLTPGAFGENLTVSGLSETSVHIGDELAVGSALLVVTQPRLPCYKLAMKLETDDIVKRFLASGRSGFYVAVRRAGEVGRGDALTVSARDPFAVTVADALRLHVRTSYGPAEIEIARRAVQVGALPAGWRETYLERIR